jgi:hypothetical protein
MRACCSLQWFTILPKCFSALSHVYHRSLQRTYAVKAVCTHLPQIGPGRAALWPVSQAWSAIFLLQVRKRPGIFKQVENVCKV